jgi:hypothetical protein
MWTNRPLASLFAEPSGGLPGQKARQTSGLGIGASFSKWGFSVVLRGSTYLPIPSPFLSLPSLPPDKGLWGTPI